MGKASKLHFIFLAFIALAYLFPLAITSPHAQIMRTARGELFDTKQRTLVGSYIYQTNDLSKRLTYQAVISRHEHNLRGERQDNDIINIAPAPAATWLVFSITNNTDTIDWVLDFGDVFHGRYGQLKKLNIRNHDRQETYAFAGDADTETQKKRNTLSRQAVVPVKISEGKTETFVIYLEPQSGIPVSIAPALLTADKYYTGQKYLAASRSVLLVLCVGFMGGFLAIAALSHQRAYGLFAVLCALHLGLLSTFDSAFVTGFSWAGELVRIGIPVIVLLHLLIARIFLNITAEDYRENMALLFAALLCVAGGAFSLIPIERLVDFQNKALFFTTMVSMAIMVVVTFLQGQKGQYTAYFFASAIITAMLGFFISATNISGFFESSALGSNFYWLLLPVQMALFMMTVLRHYHFQMSVARDMEAREQRTAYSLARLQRSKESADQARLLRVIERERELMAELREREIMRTDEMRKAKEMADEANRAKSAFLAVISHEIRTPMTGIMGILKLLQNTHITQEQADYITTIQNTGDTMVALLNDILDFEKIETGAMTLEHISIDMPQLAQGIVTLMSGHVKDKNLALNLEISKDFPRFLMGDPTRLRQVLLNLVNNAIKFTEEGHVKIIMRATKLSNKPEAIHGDYEVYFAVEDTGVGISQEAQKTLFDAFQQADSSVARKYGGSGLGLAICQRLVSAMKSHINIDSQQGVGSTFSFSLLMDADEGMQTAEDACSPAQKGVDEVADKVIEHKNPMTLIVIEDNEINRKVLESFIANLGHKSHVFSNAEEALAHIQDQNTVSVDAIFTDINLNGGMSGLEAAKAIRAFENPDVSNIPIIAITGNVGDEDLKAIEDAGMNGTLHKPIDHGKLTTMIEDLHQGAKDLRDATASEENSAPQKPAPETDAEDILDMAMLQGLLGSLGKDDTFNLLKECLDKASEIIKNMAENEDLAFLGDRAHELKGMAGNFGLRDLAIIAAHIEKAAKSGAHEVAMADNKKLPDAYRRAETAIKRWLEDQ